jgi:hypothetical protein
MHLGRRFLGFTEGNTPEDMLVSLLEVNLTVTGLRDTKVLSSSTPWLLQ